MYICTLYKCAFDGRRYAFLEIFLDCSKRKIIVFECMHNGSMQHSSGFKIKASVLTSAIKCRVKVLKLPTAQHLLAGSPF